MPGLWMVAGLGNPGPAYTETRHNAGFWFLDAVARCHGGEFRLQSHLHARTARVRIGRVDCLLVRPTTYMNHSGRAIRAVLDYFHIELAHCLVAYDELDLPPGTVRLKIGGGHGGHNGLRDILRHVAGSDFPRLRIGIGHPGLKDQVTDYVLGRPVAEQERLMRAAIDAAVEVLPDIVAGELSRAMNVLHGSASRDQRE